MNSVLATEIHLRKAFCFSYSRPLKQAVLEQIENGFWHDDFHIVFAPLLPDSSECEHLFEILFEDRGDEVINFQKLKNSLKQKLSLSYIFENSWMILEDGTFIISDGFAIARCSIDSLLWVTPRLSVDGIILQKADHQFVDGFYWACEEHTFEPTNPFRLNIDSGEIIVGQQF